MAGSPRLRLDGSLEASLERYESALAIYRLGTGWELLKSSEGVGACMQNLETFKPHLMDTNSRWRCSESFGILVQKPRRRLSTAGRSSRPTLLLLKVFSRTAIADLSK